MTDEQRRKLLDEVAEQRWKEAETGEARIRFGTPEKLLGNANAVQKEFFDYYRNPLRGYHPRYQGIRFTSQAALMNFYPFAMIKEISPRPCYSLQASMHIRAISVRMPIKKPANRKNCISFPEPIM